MAGTVSIKGYVSCTFTVCMASAQDELGFLMNLINMGRGQSACFWYCPKRKQSWILCEVMSLSMGETAEITFVRSHLGSRGMSVPN